MGVSPWCHGWVRRYHYPAQFRNVVVTPLTTLETTPSKNSEAPSLERDIVWSIYDIVLRSKSFCLVSDQMFVSAMNDQAFQPCNTNIITPQPSTPTPTPTPTPPPTPPPSRPPKDRPLLSRRSLHVLDLRPPRPPRAMDPPSQREDREHLIGATRLDAIYSIVILTFRAAKAPQQTHDMLTTPSTSNPATSHCCRLC